MRCLEKQVSSTESLVRPSSRPFAFQTLPLVPLVTGDRAVFNLPAALLQDGYYTLAMVPEPGTLLMAAVGAAVLGGCRLRRRRIRA